MVQFLCSYGSAAARKEAADAASNLYASPVGDAAFSYNILHERSVIILFIYTYIQYTIILIY